MVQLEDFQQTIEAPTASEISAAIEQDGKAILHIEFDVDKATLKPDGEKLVHEIFKVLEQSSKLNISIEGHTDNTGEEAYNKTLSEKRANTVKFLLAAKGIEIERLKSKGYGESSPIASNDSEEGKAKNRRVELIRIQ